MKGLPQIIDLLNDVLTLELTAVNQYFLHARMCENWGYERLWKVIRKESIDEMKHADRLITRILFLEGLPNLQRLGKISVGQSVKEMFTVDLDVERKSVSTLNDGIKVARDVNDNGTVELLEQILVDSEDHVDWLEKQLELISQVGEQNFLAQQIGEGEGS
jgi:bacterioferritin